MRKVKIGQLLEKGRNQTNPSIKEHFQGILVSKHHMSWVYGTFVLMVVLSPKHHMSCVYDTLVP